MDVLLKKLVEALSLPFLRIHNDNDGEEAIYRVLCETLAFVEKCKHS